MTAYRHFVAEQRTLAQQVERRQAASPVAQQTSPKDPGPDASVRAVLAFLADVVECWQERGDFGRTHIERWSARLVEERRAVLEHVEEVARDGAAAVDCISARLGPWADKPAEEYVKAVETKRAGQREPGEDAADRVEIEWERAC